MRQKLLRSLQVTGAVYVDQARSFLDSLIRDESRGSGDTENALRRIASRERVSFSSLWTLRYRPPKDVYASILFKLHAAHEAMSRRQLEALERQIGAAEKAGFGPDYLREAKALVQDAREE